MVRLHRLIARMKSSASMEPVSGNSVDIWRPGDERGGDPNAFVNLLYYGCTHRFNDPLALANRSCFLTIFVTGPRGGRQDANRWLYQGISCRCTDICCS